MAPFHVIACSVFKDALAFLAREIEGKQLSFTFLPSYLHLRPEELRKRLLVAIGRAKEEEPFVGCLYGQCFAGIDSCLDAERITRLPCDHCYESLLGRRRYRKLLNEQAGTFFVEKELLLDFDRLCRIPLELDDPEMRRIYFNHYQRVVYIQQPKDPELADQAMGVADLLKLELAVVKADYTELKAFLDQLEKKK